jgi:putative restriction endonuclease
MTLQELVDEIDLQPAFEQNGKRAPHKPLTLLYALGQALRGRRLVSFRDAEPQLAMLLDRFGPPRATQHPEQPVWRLRLYHRSPTSFWQIAGDTSDIEVAGGNPSAPRMRDRISFGLSESACSVVCNEPANARTLALLLASDIVPPTLQPALLEAVGIDVPTDLPMVGEPGLDVATSLALVSRRRVTVTQVQRDPAFSRKVLDAYGRACAICSISPKLGSDRFGLEAAHIRWARADGPDEVPNGVCLCRMHHVALDWGAIKIDGGMRVRVSSRLDRSAESAAMFHEFEDKLIHLPKETRNHPNELMLRWHWDEVYKA